MRPRGQPTPKLHRLKRLKQCLVISLQKRQRPSTHGKHLDEAGIIANPDMARTIQKGLAIFVRAIVNHKPNFVSQ